MRIAALAGPTRPTAPRPHEALAALAHRLQAFQFLLDRFWPEPGSRRIVDLGAGHGLFAQIAARRGFSVTAVDARPQWTLADALSIGRKQPSRARPEVAWIEGDVRSFDTAGFDVVLAIGLTYHLPLQAQRDFLRRTAGQATVIDTEIYDPSDPDAAACERLRPVVLDGYDGALCRETGDLWSSIDNEESFWPSHDAMLRMCAGAGRASVIAVGAPYRSRFGWRQWYVLDGPLP
ncbi:methyltransferase domain-containing protein [Propylenella binzhouense]|uniref:Class I SAM-dependent methyltransferase n=1 Tax=Propylenella binzhouense TaxID=2555902 RepID=A0A964WS42_9HYPH|nr:class I SAM-dependent methyltransferase [Propylenella binzhouense]